MALLEAPELGRERADRAACEQSGTSRGNAAVSRPFWQSVCGDTVGSAGESDASPRAQFE